MREPRLAVRNSSATASGVTIRADSTCAIDDRIPLSRQPTRRWYLARREQQSVACYRYR